MQICVCLEIYGELTIIAATPVAVKLWLIISSSLFYARTLAIESNPLPDNVYYKMISADTAWVQQQLDQVKLSSQTWHTCMFDSRHVLSCHSLTHLSLRCNQIGDEGARLIGLALSNTTSANKNLLSLNLAFNSIADAGAAHIAKVWLMCAHCVFPSDESVATAQITPFLSSPSGTEAESYFGFPLAAQQWDRRLRSRTSGWGVCHHKSSSLVLSVMSAMEFSSKRALTISDHLHLPS